MEVGTRHEELLYWFTRFEDPNCIAVVELVATIVDVGNGIQVNRIYPMETRTATCATSPSPVTRCELPRKCMLGVLELPTT